MKLLAISIFFCLVIKSLSKSQNTFKEGVIVYKCDSVFDQKRNIPDNIHREIKFYKKGDLYRLETIKKSLNKEFKDEIEVQIINETGKYIFEDPGFSLNKIAFFVSIEEEKELLSQRAMNGKLNLYKIEKTLPHKPILNIPVEEVILKNIVTSISMYILVANNIKTKFGIFFENYRKLEGTPLSFYDHEGDIILHYSAINMNQKELPNEIFYLRSNYKILTLEHNK